MKLAEILGFEYVGQEDEQTDEIIRRAFEERAKECESELENIQVKYNFTQENIVNDMETSLSIRTTWRR